jgi:hypothetical protein
LPTTKSTLPEGWYPDTITPVVDVRPAYSPVGTDINCVVVALFATVIVTAFDVLEALLLSPE